MLLDCVVSACNLDSLYCDFIPIFIESWKLLYPTVDVKIILINDKIPDKFKQYESNIICFNPINIVNKALLSQVVRILYPCIMKQYENGILITDIDMLPMNNTYYSEPIKDISNDKFICYRDVLIESDKQIAMCYNIACSNVWEKIFNVHCIDDIYTVFHKFKKECRSEWYTDQIMLYKKVMEYKNTTGDVVILNDVITKFGRLDRVCFPEISICMNNIENKIYSDYHMLRPYEKYKVKNDMILEKLKQIYAIKI